MITVYIKTTVHMPEVPAKVEMEDGTLHDLLVRLLGRLPIGNELIDRNPPQFAHLVATPMQHREYTRQVRLRQRPAVRPARHFEADGRSRAGPGSDRRLQELTGSRKRELVDGKGIEPSTSALRTRRSPS